MKFKIVNQKVDEFLINRKKCNNIIDIWTLLQGDEKSVVPSILALEKLFTTLLKRNDFIVNEDLKLTNPEAWEVETEYAKWLHESYNQTLHKICQILDSENKSTQVQALSSLMNMIRVESQHPIGKEDSSWSKLEEIITQMTSTTKRRNTLILRFQEYTQFVDVTFYTWKMLKERVLSVKEENDIFMSNVLDLVEKIPGPKALLKDGNRVIVTEPEKIFCAQAGESKFTLNGKILRKNVEKVWQNLVNRNLSVTVHRRLLVVLLESFLQSLDKPIFLTDFLMSSMNVGGAHSLLALQGMLVLIQKHNLEYPNVYGKLYNMFEPTILRSKYKSRLFYLADVFLSSTYLPEQLVAAFAKRVARLGLSAQAPDVPIIARFVGNLILRHPGMKKMIHDPVGKEVTEDPFLENEAEPTKSRAIESSLWEFSLLKRHALPRISSSVKFIDSNLPSVEWDLSEILDLTSEEMFNDEIKKKKKISVTFERPQSLANLKHNRMYKLWSFS